MNAISKKTVFICIVISVLCAGLFGQAPDTLWTRTYGGSGYDEGQSILQLSDGGYVVLGNSSSFSPYDKIYLLRINSSGDTLWSRIYGQDSSNGGYRIQPTSDSGFIIAGTANVWFPDEDCYLMKVNSSGDTLWSRKYGGPGQDEGYTVQPTSDGGYILVGTTDSYGAGGDIYLIKTGAGGDTTWTRTYGNTDVDFGTDVRELPGGGYIIIGTTVSDGPNLDDVYIIKTNPNGDTIWTKTYGRPANLDWGLALDLLPDSGFIVAGWTCPEYGINAEAYLLRLKANGDTVWTRTYGGASDDYARYVQKTPDGGFIVTGFTYSYGAGQCDVWLIKINAGGDTVWTKTVGGPDVDAGATVIPTSDHGYIAVGYSDSFDPNGDIYVIKIAPDMGVTEGTEGRYPKSVYLFEIQPNPIHDKVIVRYALSKKTRIKLSLFDIAGRIVTTLSDKDQNPGAHRENYEITNLPQGVYFITIDVEGNRETRKIILMK
jgi:hypothetical protein